MQDKIVFPGVAYLSMAAEALFQRFRDTTQVAGVRYRQISMNASLIIPDTPEGVEITFSLQPEKAGNYGSNDWYTFRVISHDEPSSSWTEHCVGHIRLEMVITGSSPSQGLGDVQSKINQLRSHKVVTDFRPAIDVDVMYAEFEASDMGFGQLLRNMKKLQISEDGKSCLSMVQAPDIPRAVHDGYLVHPCVFESILHSLLTICGPGGSSLKKCSMVATNIQEVYISRQIDTRPETVLECLAVSNRESSTLWRSQVLIESKDGKGQNIFIQGIDLVALPSTSDSKEEVGRFYNVDWKRDAKLLRSIKPLGNLSQTVVPLRRDLTADECVLRKFGASSSRLSVG